MRNNPPVETVLYGIESSASALAERKYNARCQSARSATGPALWPCQFSAFFRPRS